MYVKDFIMHPDSDAGKLVDEETRAEGRVSLRTYWTYIKAAGIVCWVFTFAFMLLIRFINVGFQVSGSVGRVKQP